MYQKFFRSTVYFNPYDTNKIVDIDLGNSKYHLYDLNTQKIVSKNAKGATSFTISGQSSVVLVLVPVEMKFSVKEGKLYAGEVVVDYWFGK